MKPTKNNFFCLDCLRPKMLFHSEKAALRCIEFNGEEMQARTGKRPIRAYFCIACGGWHITSKEYVSGQMSRIEWYFYQLHQTCIIHKRQEELLSRIYGQKNRAKSLPNVIKAIVHEFRLSVQRKHINSYKCEEIYRRLLSIFRDLISFKIITPRIEECFSQFSDVAELYHSKVAKIRPYTPPMAS